MPDLVRLYIRHVAIGFALATIFTALLLWLNVANLWHLVTHAPGGTLAVILLVVFNGIVFSGVQFGIAITGMARATGSDDGEDDGRGAVPALHPVAVPVRVDADRRRDGRRRDARG